jgi:hypothetical protein
MIKAAVTCYNPHGLTINTNRRYMQVLRTGLLTRKDSESHETAHISLPLVSSRATSSFTPSVLTSIRSGLILNVRAFADAMGWYRGERHVDGHAAFS